MEGGVDDELDVDRVVMMRCRLHSPQAHHGEAQLSRQAKVEVRAYALANPRSKNVDRTSFLNPLLFVKTRP